MLDDRIGESRETPLLICRDRGKGRVDVGALCLSSSRYDSPRSSEVHESHPNEGQAQGPHPSTSSAPCPYRIGDTSGRMEIVSYGVVIVPFALTVIWTGGRGLVAGAWGLVPSALNIAP